MVLPTSSQRGMKPASETPPDVESGVGHAEERTFMLDAFDPFDLAIVWGSANR
jgi:hypothetical protein